MLSMAMLVEALISGLRSGDDLDYSDVIREDGFTFEDTRAVIKTDYRVVSTDLLHTMSQRVITLTVQSMYHFPVQALMLALMGDEKIVGVMNDRRLIETVATPSAAVALRDALLAAGVEEVIYHDCSGENPYFIIATEGRTFSKYVLPDGTAPMRNWAVWSLPGNFHSPTPGGWHEEKGKLGLCVRGLHASISDEDILTRHVNVQKFRDAIRMPLIYELEYEDRYVVGDSHGKVVGRKARLVNSHSSSGISYTASEVEAKLSQWLTALSHVKSPRRNIYENFAARFTEQVEAGRIVVFEDVISANQACVDYGDNPFSAVLSVIANDEYPYNALVGGLSGLVTDEFSAILEGPNSFSDSNWMPDYHLPTMRQIVRYSLMRAVYSALDGDEDKLVMDEDNLSKWLRLMRDVPLNTYAEACLTSIRAGYIPFGATPDGKLVVTSTEKVLASK